jgi:hypothetical protein
VRGGDGSDDLMEGVLLRSGSRSFENDGTMASDRPPITVIVLGTRAINTTKTQAIIVFVFTIRAMAYSYGRNKPTVDLTFKPYKISQGHHQTNQQ